MAELLLRARHWAGDSDGECAVEQATLATVPQEWPRGVRHQYPLNVTVDFTKLRTNALRRYLAFHGIQEIPGSSRDELAIVVARHFNQECKLTDEETSIASFLTYIKGAKVDAGDTESVASDSSDGERRSREYPGYRSMRESRADAQGSEGASSSPSDNNDDDEEENDSESTSKPKRRRSSSASSSTQRKSGTTKKTGNKKRRTRLYCVCKGASFGNMIACDNKKCADRSNWYHMACVDLDPTQDPPETWYCPSCQEREGSDVPENQYRKPVASVTYGDMISHALTALPQGKGTFKEICDFVEKQYESQLNWKLESDQRKSPVWKSSVRKILFSNVRFRKHPDDKGLFCLAA